MSALLAVSCSMKIVVVIVQRFASRQEKMLNIIYYRNIFLVHVNIFPSSMDEQVCGDTSPVALMHFSCVQVWEVHPVHALLNLV